MLVERASFGLLRLLRAPRGFASSCHALQATAAVKSRSPRSGLRPFVPFIKSLHASAFLRGASPVLTSDGLRPRTLRLSILLSRQFVCLVRRYLDLFR